MTFTYKNKDTGETFRAADRVPPLDRNDGWDVTEDKPEKLALKAKADDKADENVATRSNE